MAGAEETAKIWGGQNMLPIWDVIGNIITLCECSVVIVTGVKFQILCRVIHVCACALYMCVCARVRVCVCVVCVCVSHVCACVCVV